MQNTATLPLSKMVFFKLHVNNRDIVSSYEFQFTFDWKFVKTFGFITSVFGRCRVCTHNFEFYTGYHESPSKAVLIHVGSALCRLQVFVSMLYWLYGTRCGRTFTIEISSRHDFDYSILFVKLLKSISLWLNGILRLFSLLLGYEHTQKKPFNSSRFISFNKNPVSFGVFGFFLSHQVAALSYFTAAQKKSYCKAISRLWLKCNQKLSVKSGWVLRFFPHLLDEHAT